MDDRSATEHEAIQAIEREARSLFGAAPTAATRLTHSRVTRGVWRVAAGEATAVVKVLALPPRGDEAAEPDSMRFWRREDHIYSAGTPAAYKEAGVRCPRLLARFDRTNGDIALWLEDVVGISAVHWDLPAFARAARRLGAAQGAYAAGTPLPSDEWLSRGFLPRYLAARKTQDDELLASDEAWRRPVIARHFTVDLRDELRRLRADRDRLLGWVQSAPATLAHLDVWPDNMFEVGDELVLIDWGFAGIGSAGEDPGNLVPDSIFDLRHPAAILPELDRTVFRAYLTGLRNAGWRGDERRVRLAMTASACKYDWIAGATLARAAATTPTQPIYGDEEIDAELLFATRATVLRFLVERAREARDLAAEVGLA
ncbi:MAG: aminoglycoside phosphotransferase [Candidatus Limnocylindrales bacterium]